MQSDAILKYYFDKELLAAGVERPPYNPIEWLHTVQLEESYKAQEFWGRFTYYQKTNSLSQAAVYMLPMYYNYYASRGLLIQVEQGYKKARAANKPFIIWIAGDYDFKIPFQEAVVILQGPDIRQKGQIRLSGPAEIKDCRNEVDIEKTAPLPKTSPPMLGFTGQASSKRMPLYILKNTLWHVQYGLGITPQKPPPFRPHILLRKKALQISPQ